MATVHFHCHLGVVQRSRSGTVALRLRYQQNSPPRRVRLRGTPVDYSVATFGGGAVLLPVDAPEWMSDRAALAAAVSARETRRDAQEGYAIDFGLPRALHPADRKAVAAFVLSPFVANGMVAAFDTHVPMASDGVEQPHVHAWIAQREVSHAGFGAKRRDWVAQMRMDRGRDVRALIAGRLNLACACLGARAAVDPRSTIDTLGRAPEARVPRAGWRRWKAGEHDAEVGALLRARQAAKAEAGVAEVAAGRTAAPTGRSLSPPWLAAENESRPYWEPISCPAGPIVPSTLMALVDEAIARGWPAVLPVGDAAFVDAVCVALAWQPSEIGWVGPAPSMDAVARISRVGLGMVAEAIAPFDRTAVCQDTLMGFRTRAEAIMFDAVDRADPEVPELIDWRKQALTEIEGLDVDTILLASIAPDINDEADPMDNPEALLMQAEDAAAGLLEDDDDHDDDPQLDEPGDEPDYPEDDVDDKPSWEDDFDDDPGPE
jgi:hypothetical protein